MVTRLARYWNVVDRHLVDRELVQIVDAALAEAVRKGGEWIACKPGCAECCLGPFPITPLDARRLQEGLAALAASDPGRAARVRARAQAAIGMGDDDPCPALDPEQRTCDLYAFRPLTCRTFGPAITWNLEAVGVCELCFDGATDDEIAACTVTLDDRGWEAQLIGELGDDGPATVGEALLTA